MELLMSRTDARTQGDRPPNLARLKLADVMLLSMGYAHVQGMSDRPAERPNAETSSVFEDAGSAKPTAVALRASVKYPVWRALVSYWGDYLTTIDIDGDGAQNALSA
jgi:hypothetical protein